MSFSVCEKVTITYPCPLTESITTTMSKHASKVRYQPKKYILDTTSKFKTKMAAKGKYLETLTVLPSPFIKGMGLIYTIKLILNFTQGADFGPQEVL